MNDKLAPISSSNYVGVSWKPNGAVNVRGLMVGNKEKLYASVISQFAITIRDGTLTILSQIILVMRNISVHIPKRLIEKEEQQLGPTRFLFTVYER